MVEKTGYVIKNNRLVFNSSLIIEEELENWRPVGCVYPQGKQSYYINSNIDFNYYKTVVVECKDGFFFGFIPKKDYKEILEKLKEK